MTFCVEAGKEIDYVGIMFEVEFLSCPAKQHE